MRALSLLVLFTASCGQQTSIFDVHQVISLAAKQINEAAGQTLVIIGTNDWRVTDQKLSCDVEYMFGCTDYNQKLIGLYVAGYDQNVEIFMAMHELGHAFGLEHSSNPNDIMHYPMTKVDFSAEDVDRFAGQLKTTGQIITID